MLTKAEFRKQWQHIPDLPMWRNKLNGVVISVAGSRDLGYYVVKKSSPMPRVGGMGAISTEDISPYFVLPTKPVGYEGTLLNQEMKENENWRPGTFRSALFVAMKYMRNEKWR